MHLETLVPACVLTVLSPMTSVLILADSADSKLLSSPLSQEKPIEFTLTYPPLIADFFSSARAAKPYERQKCALHLELESLVLTFHVTSLSAVS